MEYFDVDVCKIVKCISTTYVVSVKKGFLFHLVLTMGCAILWRHSLTLPYHYFKLFHQVCLRRQYWLSIMKFINWLDFIFDFKNGCLISNVYKELNTFKRCLKNDISLFSSIHATSTKCIHKNSVNGHDQTKLNRVCYFLLFAYKGSKLDYLEQIKIIYVLLFRTQKHDISNHG